MNKLFFSTTVALVLCCGISSAADSVSSEPVNQRAQAYYQKFVAKYGETEEYNAKKEELYEAAKGKLEACQSNCSYYEALQGYAAPDVIAVTATVQEAR